MTPDHKLPARLDADLPLMYSTPPPVPSSLAERLHARIEIARVRLANGHIASADGILNEVASSLMGCIEANPKARAKGTLAEVTQFCVSLGLPPSDGEWFFYKCEGCGWMNGKSKIKDWPATVRQWKIAGHMASQKQAPLGNRPFQRYGSPVDEPSLAENQINRMARKLRGEK